MYPKKRKKEKNKVIDVVSFMTDIADLFGHYKLSRIFTWRQEHSSSHSFHHFCSSLTVYMKGNEIQERELLLTMGALPMSHDQVS